MAARMPAQQERRRTKYLDPDDLSEWIICFPNRTGFAGGGPEVVDMLPEFLLGTLTCEVIPNRVPGDTEASNPISVLNNEGI
jgi:hypothetical protein